MSDSIPPRQLVTEEQANPTNEAQPFNERLEHALAQAVTPNGEAPHTAIAAVIDPRRASKVQTKTDAFGRPRVARRRAAKSA